MKKEVYDKEFQQKEIASVKCEEDSITLNFSDETVFTLETYHSQDCCEHVYGDWSAVKAQFQELVGQKLSQVVIKAVEEMGILVNFVTYYSNNHKVFVACYNSQNGYYSDNLSLRVKDGDTVTEVDLAGYIEDSID